MKRNVFFDTNIIVYLYTREVEKSERASALLSAGGVVSVQVLNEFVAVAQRKLRLPWPHIEAGLTAIAADCAIVPLDLDIHRKAIEICRQTRYSIYDGMILAAALASGCDTLYSEDMQDGRQVSGLAIVNPFRDA